MAKCKSGKNIALLVGINYSVIKLKGWPELTGCHNDVDAVRTTLIDVFGFNPKDIEVLTDKPGTQSGAMPTGANIKSALKRLITKLEKGDVLFFHFSGHGTRTKRHRRLLEAIVPCDKNLIFNTDFRDLVNGVPRGATFMFFSDSCHSGGLIDKEKEQIGPNVSFRGSTTQSHNPRFVPYETVKAAILATLPSYRGPEDIDTLMLHAFRDEASLLFRLPRSRSPQPPPLKPAQGILLSACQSNELAGERTNDERRPLGAFTYAVQVIIKDPKLLPQPFSNKQLVMKVREIMPTRIFKLKDSQDCNQHPCLYCSDDNVDRTFLISKKQERYSSDPNYLQTKDGNYMLDSDDSEDDGDDSEED